MLIMVLMTSLGSAAHLNSSAQEILERKVSLDVQDKEIMDVLSEIENQTSVMFTYRPEVVNTLSKITLKVVDTRLSEVLDRLFADNVSMIVVDDEAEIVLMPKLNQVESQPVEEIRLAVSGRVIDDANEPLPGVNVLEKGTTNGTTTGSQCWKSNCL